MSCIIDIYSPGRESSFMEATSIMGMNLEGNCPDEFCCPNGSHGYSAISDLHIVPAIVIFISAIVSMLGAALILFAYCAFKDLRKGVAQKIITLLALADIGTAASLMLGNLNLFVYRHYRSDIIEDKEISACLNFNIVCQIQAFLGVGFSISGYIWTALLAVHLFLATVLRHSSWTEKLLPLYNIVAWTLPIIVSLPLLLSGKLGYTPTYPTTCYISAYAVEHESSNATLIVEEVIVWSVEVVCAIITVVCFVIIIAYIRCKRHDLHPAQRVCRRLLAIPIAYLFLRLWDAVQFGLGVTLSPKEPLACASHNLQVASFVISIVQLIADTGQGWINCILFIFLSAELRRRLFVLPFRRFMRMCRIQQFQNALVTTEATPLIQRTEKSPSDRAIALEAGDTYVSLYISKSVDCCSSQNELGSRA